MIPPVLLWLAGLLVRLVAAIAQPRTATCPLGTFVHGVRPTGESECIVVADPRPDDTKERCHHTHLDQPALPVRVRCRRGELAVVKDERTIECRRTAPLHGRSPA